MKTYFKNPDVRSYLMLDSETNHAVTLFITNTVKSVIYSEDLITYTNHLNNSTDETKWISVDQSTFENIKTDIFSAL